VVLIITLIHLIIIIIIIIIETGQEIMFKFNKDTPQIKIEEIEFNNIIQIIIIIARQEIIIEDNLITITIIKIIKITIIKIIKITITIIKITIILI